MTSTKTASSSDPINSLQQFMVKNEAVLNKATGKIARGDRDAVVQQIRQFDTLLRQGLASAVSMAKASKVSQEVLEKQTGIVGTAVRVLRTIEQNPHVQFYDDTHFGQRVKYGFLKVIGYLFTGKVYVGVAGKALSQTIPSIPFPAKPPAEGKPSVSPPESGREPGAEPGSGAPTAHRSPQNVEPGARPRVEVSGEEHKDPVVQTGLPSGAEARVGAPRMEPGAPGLQTGLPSGARVGVQQPGAPAQGMQELAQSVIFEEIPPAAPSEDRRPLDEQLEQDLIDTQRFEQSGIQHDPQSRVCCVERENGGYSFTFFSRGVGTSYHVELIGPEDLRVTGQGVNSVVHSLRDLREQSFLGSGVRMTFDSPGSFLSRVVPARSRVSMVLGELRGAWGTPPRNFETEEQVLRELTHREPLTHPTGDVACRFWQRQDPTGQIQLMLSFRIRKEDPRTLLLDTATPGNIIVRLEGRAPCVIRTMTADGSAQANRDCVTRDLAALFSSPEHPLTIMSPQDYAEGADVEARRVAVQNELERGAPLLGPSAMYNTYAGYQFVVETPEQRQAVLTMIQQCSGANQQGVYVAMVKRGNDYTWVEGREGRITETPIQIDYRRNPPVFALASPNPQWVTTFAQLVAQQTRIYQNFFPVPLERLEELERQGVPVELPATYRAWRQAGATAMTVGQGINTGWNLLRGAIGPYMPIVFGAVREAATITEIAVEHYGPPAANRAGQMAQGLVVGGVNAATNAIARARLTPTGQEPPPGDVELQEGGPQAPRLQEGPPQPQAMERQGVERPAVQQQGGTFGGGILGGLRRLAMGAIAQLRTRGAPPSQRR